MRLTCPNCGARYEVDDAMIPAEGRDVQCSECTTTWFQPGRRPERAVPPPSPPPIAASEDEGSTPETPSAAEAASVEAGVAKDEAPAAHGSELAAEVDEPQSDAPVDGEPAATEPVAQDDDADASHPEAMETATQVVTDNAEVEPPEAVAAAAPRDLDPGVRDILKEEADREARLKQAEAEQVETQSEMPLEEEPEAVNRARRRSELEDAENSFDVPPASAATPNGSRRDLLPDIEEINSTLRASDDSAAEAKAAKDAVMAEAGRRRRGVRLGFFLTLALTAGLIWAYVNAPGIVRQVPAAAPAVENFVGQVDRARLWLDDLARGLVEDG